ncbi:KamA family radical SAM protein [candidate division KSB1 bacterium]|nr:KamA family radical SAM protein [candidate division KSB1 bacterium]
MHPKYVTRLEKVPGIKPNELALLERVSQRFAFRANEYYLSLIDWKNPQDPIRRLIIPNPRELNDWGRVDASQEDTYTKIAGLQHKYPSTAVLLVTDVCGGFCRYCFRKRLFFKNNQEVNRDLSDAFYYIRHHPEINNILLTGGDPLMLATAQLKVILEKLRQIKHIQIIRIGTKIPAFNPFRILHDPALLETISTFSKAHKKIYFMVHFTHPHELTLYAIEAIERLRQAGAITVNQTPLIKGINDDPRVLGKLFNKLSYIGVAPYYVFQCRPTIGNQPFVIPIEKAYQIFEQARMNCSGLAKRARYVMSHQTGKIEIVGKTEQRVYFKYHRAAHPEDSSRFLIYESNPGGYWLEDYQETRDEFVMENPFMAA